VSLCVAIAGCASRALPVTSDAPAGQATITAAPADDVVPAGALRVYVWKCQDGQTIVMRNLFRDRAVELVFAGGTRRLEQTVSASGVRYADEGMVFWTKGRTATLERQGAGLVQCDERRYESLLEDARARGVVYRALGNEPGWVLEVGPGSRLDWTTNYGQERHAFAQSTESVGTEPASAIYVARSGAESIRVTVRQQPCTDDGDVAYDYSAVVEFGDALYRGCATRLDASR
jgi:membrane-bound inhibitor of C-type lysozyme/uncharacterized membrane protein